MAVDFNKRHKVKEVKRNTISHILKNSTQIFDASANMKELKIGNGPKYPELEIALLACFKHVFIIM